MMEKIAIIASVGIGRHVAEVITQHTSITPDNILIMDDKSFPITNPFHDIAVINTLAIPQTGQDKRRERRKSQRKRFR